MLYSLQPQVPPYTEKDVFASLLSCFIKGAVEAKTVQEKQQVKIVAVKTKWILELGKKKETVRGIHNW